LQALAANEAKVAKAQADIARKLAALAA
jgi:hypothetical protein